MKNIGLLGGGIVARGHLISSQLMISGKYTAVCEIDQAKRNAICKEYALTGYGDIDDMLKNEKLDILVIGTPHVYHMEPAIKAMEKGVNVLIEKPLEISLERCQKIIDTEKKTGARVFVGHMQRYIKENVWAKRILKSGRLGEPFHTHDTIYMQYFTKGRPQWFLQKDKSGGGIIWNHGVHQIDRNSWLHESRVKEIFADIRFHEEKPDLDSHLELSLFFENGRKANIQTDGYGGKKNEVEVFCSKGFLSYRQDFGLTVMENISDRTVYGDAATETIDIPNFDFPFATEIENFIDAIDSGKEIELSSEYGKYVISVIIAAYKSNKERRIVKLSEVL